MRILITVFALLVACEQGADPAPPIEVEVEVEDEAEVEVEPEVHASQVLPDDLPQEDRPPQAPSMIRDALDTTVLETVERPERVEIERTRRPAQRGDHPVQTGWVPAGGRTEVPYATVQGLVEALLRDESYSDVHRGCAGRHGVRLTMVSGDQTVHLDLARGCNAVSFTRAGQEEHPVGFLRPEIAELWTEMLSRQVRSAFGPAVIAILEHPETVELVVEQQGEPITEEVAVQLAPEDLTSLVEEILTDTNYQYSRQCLRRTRGWSTAYTLRFSAEGESVSLRLRMPFRITSLTTTLPIPEWQGRHPLIPRVARSWTRLATARMDLGE